MAKLTQRQENFCIKYVECGNASEAYRYAYSTSNMQDHVIHNKASLTMQKGEVMVRIDELNKKAEDNAIMSLEDRKKWLTDLIKHTDTEQKKVFDNDRLKALDLLNKMDAVYVNKTDITGDLNVVAKVIKLPSRKDV